MKIGLAQINPTVGALSENFDLILQSYHAAVADGAQVVVTPELALTGYPPQDLVFKSRFVHACLEHLDRLHRAIGEVPLVVGYVDENTKKQGLPFRNAAAILQHGQPVQKIFKTLLPTYDVFDEGRYFEPGEMFQVFPLMGYQVGITICEDIWPPEFLYQRLYHQYPVEELVARGAQLILNLSASPFHLGKQSLRKQMLTAVAMGSKVPIVYCNAIGGNDQLIFDGNSLIVDAEGQLIQELPEFQECTRVVSLSTPPPYSVLTESDEIQQLHDALVLGLQDYCKKCGFKSAVLGLSGGLDSAVVAALAAEALGAENVTGVTMPSVYSSSGSITDSIALAENLKIHFEQIPIQPTVDALIQTLNPLLAGTPADTTEENLQPRVRATILMALSNKFGHILLSTGNKSELAVGYCTLYGDMAGGLAVISDVPKTMVYKLAEYINRDREIIPINTITKPPSAELKPDQKDQDTLPEYPLLDAILKLYIEDMHSAADIIAAGYDEQTVRWVQRRVDLNEYKREQAAPGLRVTTKAFGNGRRMPIAQRFVD